jgi:hypothetical protein
MGGFLEPIGHLERRGAVIFVTMGVEHDKQNPPLQKQIANLMMADNWQLISVSIRGLI